MSESCPKLLNLISKEKEKMVNEGRSYGTSTNNNEDNKLELRLGLPGGDGNWSNTKQTLKSRERNNSSSSPSLLSLGYYSSPKHNNNGTTTGGGGGGGMIGCVQEQGYNPWTTPSSSLSSHHKKQQTEQHSRSCVQQQEYKQTKGVTTVMGKESSQPCCTRIPDLQSVDHNNNNKAFSSPSANTAVPNTSQKRAAPAPVVGWPPIRSFRKNLASSSSGKGAPEPQSAIPSKPVNEKPVTNDTARKGMYVKINMDGVPIGRKVDLSAYSSYDSLSTAVDELFRGLLAAQRDSPVGAMDNEHEKQKPITGLLDGSGEYTLVYEDNEGDRMLVGDVPWHMFASTVKRLRVLKSSDLASLSLGGGNKEGKAMVEIPSK